MPEYKKQSLYNFAIVIMGIILIVVSYSEITDDGSPEIEYIYPSDFFADTYDHPYRDKEGAVWHPERNNNGDLHWVRSPGGRVHIAPDGRIMPTTLLSEEDRHKSCVECHEDKK